MDIQKLLDFDRRAKEDGKRYPNLRMPWFSNVESSLGRHFTGIVGPRGSGKTIMLKQISLKHEDSFYLSLDTLGGENLFDIAKLLFDKYHVKYLLLDEIHFQKGFERDLKNIFDFLDLRIIFTSSVALAMTESAYDLSRRVQIIKIFPFSFREYLFFAKGINLTALTIDDIIDERWTAEHLKLGHMFDDYLKGGLYPFSLEEPALMPLFENILKKIVEKDIPLVANLFIDEIQAINKVITFIGRSKVDGINYSSIAKNVGITRYKAQQYVELLEKSFILNPIFPYGTNVLKEPKVLMYLPFRFLFVQDEEAKGAVREDFFAMAMKMAGLDFYYLKSTRGAKTPDFLIQREEGEIVLEVGGKGKGRSQFKDFGKGTKIRLTDSVNIRSDCRPLFMFGYLI